MADFKLDRIRFTWKNTWTISTTYIKDDIVIYNGKAYVCLVGHESSASNFYADLQHATPKWELMFDGYEWKGDWQINTFYSNGNLIKWKGYVYQCINPHTSNGSALVGPTDVIGNWTLVATTYNWRNTWQPSTIYELGDVITYNGITYICNTRHASANTTLGLENDQAKWDIQTRSDNWTVDWTTNTRYRVDDIVKYGAVVYRCITGHTSNADVANGLEADQAKWEVVIDGIEYKGNWTASTRYKYHDLVKWGHTIWRATAGHTSTTTLREDEANWEVWLPALGYERIWNSELEYQKGDIVLYGGYAYTALQNNTNVVPSINGILQDTGVWELLKQGYRHLGEWNNTTAYQPGDVIRNNGYLYVAVADNTFVYPDSDTSKWQLLVEGEHWRAEWQDATEYFLGDVVTYASTAYRCIARHTSTASDSRPDLDIQQPDQDYWIVLVQGKESNVLTTIGDLRTHDGTDTVRQAIGSPGNVLKTISNNITWEDFEVVPSSIFYVSTNGVDSNDNGRTLAAPFRTVKFACEYIAENLGIKRFNNINYDYTGADDVYMLELALTNMIGGSLTNAPALETFLDSINPRTGVPYFDITAAGGANPTSNDAAAALNYLAGNSGNSAEANLRIKEIIDYINANANTFDGEYITYNTVDYDVVITTYPNTTVFIKTGLYEEILPIRVPKNCALVGDELRSTTITPATGYNTANMFYVNNGSGIRNMTLQGLSGILGLPNQYGTKRPTAGAFVSLDPGTGPTDESVWITTKSPYVQNVTTFGTGCIGMKIDGSLHNGGNRSIVANDFTQVLSDGIGYWANELGRSELVSVFTYYCYIGYLTTEGGILRATNGNNSYGTFGSRAEGVNADETPITGTINNRDNEALVDIVHTNGSNVLGFGYSHAGKHYTSATTTLVGGGTSFAAHYDEFRNGAISNIRVNGVDSTTPGGLNYQYLLNNAQGGTSGSITLAASDTTGTSEKYVGMRIFITAGTGTGQYATISGYNDVSKVATIENDFNGANIWQHIRPGTPIETTLDSTTRYYIEPKVVISEADSALEINDNPTNSIINLVYYDGRWAGINNTTRDLYYSDNLSTWSTINLPDNGGSLWNKIITSGVDGNWLIIQNTIANSDILVSTDSGDTWGVVNTGSSLTFTDATYDTDTSTWYLLGKDGGDYYYLTSNNNGSTWSAANSLTTGASSGPTQIDYHNGTFVAIENAGASGIYKWTSTDGSSWTRAQASTRNIATTGEEKIFYAQGKWIVTGGASTGSSDSGFIYSFDGLTWYYVDPDTRLSNISYSQGLFVATNNSNQYWISQDLVSWKNFFEDSTIIQAPLGTAFNHIVGGNDPISDNPVFIASSNDNVIIKFTFGAKPFIRATIDSSRVRDFRIYDPGSGYETDPVVTIFDPENTIEAIYTVYKDDGVLSQPKITNTGTGYVSATATISGDGYAEIFQTGNRLKLSNVTREPGPGANLQINGIDDVIYRVTAVDSVTGSEPNLNIEIRITPTIGNEESPVHAESVIIREEYSQIRLTGHDFLDIGTGNQSSTRYPDLYVEGQSSENETQQFNEVTEAGGGRVFYTSTDQDGNFRVGELFRVEQATGIVTISADFFDLTGLTEISLGGVIVGGSEVVIREFSKESTFVANSNNIVPTQAAIIRYLEARLSGGGSDALTNVLIAGQVRVSSSNMTTTSGFPIEFPGPVVHKGGTGGDYAALQYFTAGQVVPQ